MSHNRRRPLGGGREGRPDTNEALPETETITIFRSSVVQKWGPPLGRFTARRTARALERGGINSTQRAEGVSTPKIFGRLPNMGRKCGSRNRVNRVSETLSRSEKNTPTSTMACRCAALPRIHICLLIFARIWQANSHHKLCSLVISVDKLRPWRISIAVAEKTLITLLQ